MKCIIVNHQSKVTCELMDIMQSVNCELMDIMQSVNCELMDIMQSVSKLLVAFYLTTSCTKWPIHVVVALQISITNGSGIYQV